jgi:hypothetical protein
MQEAWVSEYDPVNSDGRTGFQIHHTIDHPGLGQKGEVLRAEYGFSDPAGVQQIRPHGPFEQGPNRRKPPTIPQAENNIADGSICNITILDDQDLITNPPFIIKLLQFSPVCIFVSVFNIIAMDHPQTTDQKGLMGKELDLIDILSIKYPATIGAVPQVIRYPDNGGQIQGLLNAQQGIPAIIQPGIMPFEVTDKPVFDLYGLKQ